MSKYTVELGELIEAGVDIGLKDYPIWSEDYRPFLNKKITDHYYFREIGHETPGRFIKALNIKMREIMPYYNKLFETTLLQYNPLDVVDYTEEYTKTNDNKMDRTSTLENNETGESNGTANVKGNSSVNTTATDTKTDKIDAKNVEIDTPQTRINGLGELDSYDHASKVTFDKANNSSTDNATSNSTSNDDTTTTSESEIKNTLSSEASNSETEALTEILKKRIKGNYTSTTFQTLIKQQREIIIDIDMKIVRDLAELFMMIY